MQHQPDPVLGVEAQLEEVVAAAQGAELVAGLWLQVADGGGELLEVVPQLRVALHRLPVLLEPDRDGALDLAAQAGQRVGQVVRGQAGAEGGEAAADIDADRRGREGALHGDDRADGRALPVVDVGHGGDVVEHPGQLRDVPQLVQGDRLDLPRIGPGQHVHLVAPDALHATLHVAFRKALQPGYRSASRIRCAYSSRSASDSYFVRGQKNPRSPSPFRRGTTCTCRCGTLCEIFVFTATKLPSAPSPVSIARATRCTAKRSGSICACGTSSRSGTCSRVATSTCPLNTGLVSMNAHTCSSRITTDAASSPRPIAQNGHSMPRRQSTNRRRGRRKTVPASSLVAGRVHPPRRCPFAISPRPRSAVLHSPLDMGMPLLGATLEEPELNLAVQLQEPKLARLRLGGGDVSDLRPVRNDVFRLLPEAVTRKRLGQHETDESRIAQNLPLVGALVDPLVARDDVPSFTGHRRQPNFVRRVGSELIPEMNDVLPERADSLRQRRRDAIVEEVLQAALRCWP